MTYKIAKVQFFGYQKAMHVWAIVDADVKDEDLVTEYYYLIHTRPWLKARDYLNGEHPSQKLIQLLFELILGLKKLPRGAGYYQTFDKG